MPVEQGVSFHIAHPAGEQRDALEAAMLGALTALEGLLPILPPAVILSHLIGPTTGDDEQSAPTVPVQLLLAPDVHRLATPQMLNRVAGILLQVTSPRLRLQLTCV